MRIPVTVEGSAAGGDLGPLTVEVSYDQGETRPEPRVRNRAVQVTNPEAGGGVSFRAEVSDRDGNRTSRTVIDVYRTA